MATLVVLAAGLGSRYGGLKQMDGVGPGGELLLEYAVHDALRAGFEDAVVIIKRPMLEDFRRICGKKLEKRLPLRYAMQDEWSFPRGFAIPSGREKPYGTAQAVLAAAEQISEPFAVVNSDDYYGPEPFEKIYGALTALPAEGRAAMISYRLGNTVPDTGAVTRGVCATERGRLVSIEETRGIELMPGGAIAAPGRGILPPETEVSMNFWGFTPWILGPMREYTERFLAELAPGDLTGECLLPVMVEELLREGRLAVDALSTGSAWFGMTYPADRAETARRLRQLHEAGLYPPEL